MTRRHTPLVLVAALLASVAAWSSPARAVTTPTSEAYPVPASGVFTLDGHGFGHGHGMSQWGSQGAATLGLSADTITSTYYPGTSRRVLAPAPVRVWITSDNDRETRVYPATGLRAVDGGTDLGLLPSGFSMWRVTLAGDGVHEQLSGLRSVTWVPLGGDRTGPVRFTGPSTIRLALPDGSSRSYRGTVGSVPWAGATVRTVVALPLEDYLLSVVPSESYASWLPAALQSQAIAARSYSAYGRAHPPLSAAGAYDLCDSTSCQVFRGTTTWSAAGVPTQVEVTSTSDAVRATAGVVRSSSATSTVPIFAEFSASNGGWEADGGVSYLPARQDAWDGVVPSSAHTWSAQLSVATLVSHWPAVGRLVTLNVVSRDGHGEWGGRVQGVQLRGVAPDGSPTLVTTTGDSVRSVAGLRSSWWRPRQPPADELTPGAFATGPGVVELARRLPIGTVAERTWTAGGLSAEQAAGGAVVGTPAVVSRPSGGLELFGRSASGHLMTTHRSGTAGWGAWQDLGGALSGRPSVVRGRSDELHVFAVWSDGQVHHRWSLTPGSWSAWEALGGAALAGTGPAAVSVSAGSYDVVLLGRDHAVWRRSYRGGWSGWTSLGGVLSGDPSLTSAAGELTLVARASNLAFYVETFSGTTLSGWHSIGGLWLSNPAATAVPGSGRVDAFATGLNSALYRASRTATTWTAWQRLS